MRGTVQNAAGCMQTPECYQAALSQHLLLLKDEAAVDALLEQQPHSLDAVVIFPDAAAAAAAAAETAAAENVAPAAASRGSTAVGRSARSLGSSSSSSSERRKQLVGCGAPGPPDGDGLLLDYVIRMNSSDVPPTQLLQDLFDVSPGVMPLPGNLLW